MSSLFVLAGEASGDRIGASLLGGLSQAGHRLDISGVGGEAMADVGLRSIFPIDDLSVMGYRDVILRLPKLLLRARQVIRYILRHQPDVVVLIDAQVFSKVVTKALRRRGYHKPVVLYVAPAVWAWGSERAKTLSQLYTEVLSVLPFEPQAMQTLGGPRTAYVGHPAINKYRFEPRDQQKGALLLLPGSRPSEIAKHMPAFETLAERLSHHPRVTEIIIPTTSEQDAFVRSQTRHWKVSPRIVSDAAGRMDAFTRGSTALAVSGTITLELALAGIPHVLTYIAEPAQVRLFQNATTRFIGLPNIIAGQAVVPEILFAKRAEPKKLHDALIALLDSTDARRQQIAAFKNIRTLMEKGAPEAPLEDPVARIAAYLPPA